MTDTAASTTVIRAEDEHIDQVRAIIRAVLSRPDLGDDDDVMDHGGTSLSVVRILAEAGRVLGADINPRDLAGSVTARSVAGAAR